MPLDGGLGREAVERQSLHRGEGLVAEEVIEAPAQAVRHDLKRTHRRSDQAGFHLTDEALGQLSASQLRLAHSELSARSSYTFPERARSLDSLRKAGHPTLPLMETGLKDALPGPR